MRYGRNSIMSQHRGKEKDDARRKNKKNFECQIERQKQRDFKRKKQKSKEEY